MTLCVGSLGLWVADFIKGHEETEENCVHRAVCAVAISRERLISECFKFSLGSVSLLESYRCPVYIGRRIVKSTKCIWAGTILHLVH